MLRSVFRQTAISSNIMTTNKLSTLEVIIKGYLLTNIPTIVIMLIIWFGLWKMFNINYVISLFLGATAGWYYWTVSIKKWIKWAKSSGLEKEQIVKIGRLSLLLWNKSTVDNVFKNK